MTPKEATHIIRSTLAYKLLLYITVGVICYLALGDSIADIVLFSLPYSKPYTILIQVLYAIVICLSFPLSLYPVNALIEKGIKSIPCLQDNES